MKTNSIRSISATALTIIVFLGALNGCSGKTQEISDIRVTQAEPTSIKGEIEEFPLPNCGGSGELKQSLGMQTSVKKNLTVGTRATVSGGGEVSIPEAAKLKLEAAIELAYQQTYETASSRTDSVELKAAPGTHIVYVIQWEEQQFSSTVSYAIQGEVYKAPYTYILHIPKVSESYPVSCPSINTASIDETPTATLTHTPTAPATYTATNTPLPTDTPTPTAYVYVYELNHASSYEILAGGPNRGGGSASMACPSGYIITGLLGKKGDYITGIGLYCSLLRNDGMTGERISTKVYGNNGGVTWDSLMCPPDKALTGINGVYGGYVDRIQGICSYVANIDNPEPSETGWAGEGGADINTSSCDPGYFVTGIKIKWGDYIDGLTMICTQVVRR